MKRKTWKKTCPICRESFTSTRPNQIYCCQQCSTKAYYLRHPRPKKAYKYPKVCEMCGDKYLARVKNQRFCCADCRYAALAADLGIRDCLHCGKPFAPICSAQKYCKDSCTLAARRLRKKKYRVLGKPVQDPRTAIELKVKRVHPLAKIPVYSTEGAAGFDLFALEEVILYPGEWKTIRLGIAFEIPAGWQIEIRPRSGLSFNTGILAKNTVGTIDADYRGEVCFCALNISTLPVPIRVSQGDRVCQGVLMPAFKARFIEATRLTKTVRNESGFGSTGR